MITLGSAKKLLEKELTDSYIEVIMSINNKYIFSTQLNNSNGSTIDGFYSVDKSTGKVSGYSPVANPKEFKMAMKNIVWKKTGG